MGGNMKTLTYYTIQHLSPGADEWRFSNYDSISHHACMTSVMGNEDVFRYLYSNKRGHTNLESAFKGLAKVIELTAEEYPDHKFRLVKVLHTFDIVEPV